jgi:hypothetical protein
VRDPWGNRLEFVMRSGRYEWLKMEAKGNDGRVLGRVLPRKELVLAFNGPRQAAQETPEKTVSCCQSVVNSC